MKPWLRSRFRCPKTRERASLSRNRAALSAESRGRCNPAPARPGVAFVPHSFRRADGPVTLALTHVPLGSFGRCQVGCGPWRLPSAPRHRAVHPWSPSSRGGIHGNRGGQPETPLPWSPVSTLEWGARLAVLSPAPQLHCPRAFISCRDSLWRK